MGIDSDAYLAYGVDFGEEGEFPWEGEEYNGDIEDWWREIKGFSPSVVPDWLADDSLERQAVVKQYFDERKSFDEANPLPVDVIGHCSDDYMMTILAVKGTEKRADRGDPVEIAQSDMFPEPNAQKMIDFCKEYGIELPSEPTWLLFSYMG